MHVKFWGSFNRLFGNFMSYLTTTLHSRSLFHAFIWTDKGYSVCWRICVCKSTRYKHRTVSTLVWLAPDTEVEALDARPKRLQFHVVVKTCHDWINALLLKKKETEVAAVSGVANPSPAPALTALNNFNALSWKY